MALASCLGRATVGINPHLIGHRCDQRCCIETAVKIPASSVEIVNCVAKCMQCKRCLSENSKKFSAEVAIRFPGVERFDNAIVWAFPEIFVCLDCGVARFVLPDMELEVLRTGAPVEGANVWLGILGE